MGIHGIISECSGLRFSSMAYSLPPWQLALQPRREAWASYGKRAWGQMIASRLAQPLMFLCRTSGLVGSYAASLEGRDTTASTGTRHTTSAGAATRTLTVLAEKRR